MLNEIRMIFFTIGTVMIGILTAVYFKMDAERMAELQRKEARMHQIRLQMKSSSSGYKNYHQYNMRRMK